MTKEEKTYFANADNPPIRRFWGLYVRQDHEKLLPGLTISLCLSLWVRWQPRNGFSAASGKMSGIRTPVASGDDFAFSAASNKMEARTIRHPQ